MALFATVAIADELEDIVMHSGPSAHVYEETRHDKNTAQLRVSPLFPGEIKALGEGRIFNLEPVVKSHGINLKAGELVLYSPKSDLLFCRGFYETRDLIRSLFESCDHDSLLCPYQFTLWAAVSEPVAKRRAVMRGRSVSGGLFEVAMREGQEFALEFITGPDGQNIDVTVKGQVQLGDDIIKISTRCTGKVGEDIVLFERPVTEDSKGIDQLVLQIEALPTERQQYHDEKWQKAQARKIASELTKTSRANGKAPHIPLSEK